MTYQQRAEVHRTLDEAVAYGLPANPPDDEVLARLFALNPERAEDAKPSRLRPDE